MIDLKGTFINTNAEINYQKLKNDIDLNQLLIRMVNLEQMVLDVKKHLEILEQRISFSGIERIG